MNAFFICKNRSRLCNLLRFLVFENSVLSVVIVFVFVLVVVIVVFVLVVVLIFVLVVFVVKLIFVSVFVIHFYHPVLVCAAGDVLFKKFLFNIRPDHIYIFICQRQTFLPLSRGKS